MHERDFSITSCSEASSRFTSTTLADLNLYPQLGMRKRKLMFKLMRGSILCLESMILCSRWLPVCKGLDRTHQDHKVKVRWRVVRPISSLKEYYALDETIN